MSRTIQNQFVFDDFLLEPSERRLFRQGEPVSLEAKAFSLLLILVERSGKLVTKKEILDAVWDDAFVEEGNIPVKIGEIRKVLGDTVKKQDFIQTVTGFGYRFCKPVESLYVFENQNGTENGAAFQETEDSEIIGDNDASPEEPERTNVAVIASLKSRLSADLEELLETYEKLLTNKVSRVKMFGDATNYPIGEVFVELSIKKISGKDSSVSDYLQLLDSELRRLRLVEGSLAEGKVDQNRSSSETASIFDPPPQSPEDLLTGKTHAIVTGAPGCGKTTLLKFLTWKTIETTNKKSRKSEKAPFLRTSLPLFIELKELTKSNFVQGNLRLEDVLFEKGIRNLVRPKNEEEVQLLKDHFFEALGDGRVDIFLDGLDEVSGAEFFVDLQAMVGDFLASPFGENTLIVTTRPFGISQLGDMEMFEISPFNLDQIAAFIEHFFGKSPETEKFQVAIRNRRELRELARIPALLGFVVRSWKSGTLFGSSKLDLYSGIVNEQARQLDNDKPGVRPDRKWLVPDFDGSIKRDFLGELAFFLLFQDIVYPAKQIENNLGRFIFSGETVLEAARLFTKQLKELDGIDINPRFLAEDAKATPLLRQVGANKFAFLHLTLHEYLAAVQLARRDDCTTVYCKAYLRDSLTGLEVLPMAVACFEKPDELIDAIDSLPESLSFSGLNLITRAFDYQPSLSTATLDLVTDKLCDFFQRYDPEGLECYNFFGWLRYNLPLVDRFAGFIDSEIEEISWQTANLLGFFENEIFIENLSCGLRKSSARVRKESIKSLAKIRSSLVAELFISGLKDEDATVRAEAARALSEIQDKTAIPALLEAKEKYSETEYIYSHALHSMGYGGPVEFDKLPRTRKIIGLIENSDLDITVKQILIRDLSIDEPSEFLDKQIKAYCREGIRRIDAHIMANKLERDIPPIITIEAAVKGLSVSRDRMPELKAKLEAALASDRSGVIARLRSEFENVVEDENRIEMDFGSPNVSNITITANEYQERIIEALSYLPHVDVVAALILASEAVSNNARWTIVKRIESMPTSIITEGLLKAMSDPNTYVRATAVRVSGYYSTVGLRERLSHIAETDATFEVQFEAKKALEELQNKERYF